ncbi:hypothetical protein BJ878DRAFT_491281, partial [Calycina marina]
MFYSMKTDLQWPGKVPIIRIAVPFPTVVISNLLVIATYGGVPSTELMSTHKSITRIAPLSDVECMAVMPIIAFAAHPSFEGQHRLIVSCASSDTVPGTVIAVASLTGLYSVLFVIHVEPYLLLLLRVVP